jgi:hypothetical protein
MLEKISQKDIDRFWSHIDIRNEDECWEWKLSKDKDGYGRLKVRKNNVIYMIRANRFSYMVTFGEIPENMSILHSCDNPSCVNPKHLRAGTLLDNANDREIRKRHKHLATTIGEECYSSKIKESDVPVIRRLYEENILTLKEIGDMYGIGERTIYSIARGTSWSYVDGAIQNRRPPHRKLNEKDIKEIRYLYANGASRLELAKKYDVTKTNIKHIVNFKTWKWVKNDNDS